MVKLPFLPVAAMVFSPFHTEDEMVVKMIRGDVALAQKIFNEPGKRRLIERLQREGWPIFDLAGKRCAYEDDLDGAISRARKAALKRKPRSKAAAAQTAA